MERLLTVSRAAKLIGISRNNLQKKIANGELPSFEGKVKLSDLTTHFPDLQIEDNTFQEKLEEIIDNAFTRARSTKLQKLLTPDLGTLATRVYLLSKELAGNRASLHAKNQLLNQTLTKISELKISHDKISDIDMLQRWLEENINTPVEMNTFHSLLAKDTILRLVTAQVHLVPSGHEYLVEGNNSILESALSSGFAMNYGCNNGKCGKCKARLISGEVQATRQPEYVLSATERDQGYILTCSNTAVTDIVLQAQEALDESDIPYQELDTYVKNIKQLSTDLYLLTLTAQSNSRLRFLAGQSARLILAQDVEATLPIASCPCEDKIIQFHISAENSSNFTQFIAKHLNPGDPVQLKGPEGNFILDPDSIRPLLFLAFDSGFAPIKSLIEHALTLNHTELAHLFRFTSTQKPVYLDNLCRSWADNIDTFRYTSLTFNASDRIEITNKLIEMLKSYKELPAFDIYVAGKKDEIELTAEFIKQHNVPASQFRTYIIL